MRTHTGQISLQSNKCNKTGRPSSHLKQHQLTYQKSSTDNTEPQSSEPRQWVVISGQCLPIKQEMEENTSKVIVKQEKGECVPMTQELEGKASSVIVEQEVGPCLPIRHEFEENANKVIVKQEMDSFSQ